MRTYLDNAATTQVDPRVVKAMLPFYSKRFGNPSSLHAWGRDAAEALEESRATLAKALNCVPEEIFFTSGGTESDNLAIAGVRGLKRAVTSSVEHPAVLEAFKALETRGVKVDYLPVDREGVVRLAEAERAFKNAGLISVMHANNEVGAIQPLRALAEAKGDALFHTDAVQSFGKLELDLKRLDVDLVSVSGHKIHGPKGVGALFIRSGLRLEPLSRGGGQEHGIRPGTENVAGIIGFATAVELAFKTRKADGARLALLRDDLIKRVLDSCEGAWLNGPRGSRRLCNNAHFGFPGVEGEALVLTLDAAGVAGSTGSACSSKSLKPSHVLLAMGLNPVQAHGSLRLSLSRFTTRREIEYAALRTAEAYARLGAFSSVSRGEVTRIRKK
ncbi:MAG: cysteine desulfurase family protein [Candidatus Micrarchaeia archaeon]